MVQNSCGLWTSIRDISTIPKAFTEPICVSEELGNAISDWKMNSTGSNLFEHLHELHGVPEVEKYEFLQDFIKNGELLDDIYMNGEIPDEAFIPSVLNVEECMCRVLKIDGNIYGSGPTVIEYHSGSISTGVYILKINHGHTSLTKKIIRS
jgi:hypothetical protein